MQKPQQQMMQAVPVYETSHRELSSWARIQEMQETFINRTGLEELEQMALIDRASGLTNSRTFMREYGREFMRARRRRSPLSMCLVEVLIPQDQNRQQAIGEGDAALKAVGAIVEASLRETDFCGRYNKDELAICLTDCEPAGAAIFADRLRTTVHNELRSKQGYWNLAVRFGLGSYPANAADKDQLIAKIKQSMTLSYDSREEIIQVP